MKRSTIYTMNIILWLKKITSRKAKVIVILGPTATGKTSLSIDIAKRYGGEIISADSRQVYRQLDIGSAKVTTEEMENIPHHMIDIADLQRRYTAQEFVEQASEHIADILARKKTPIICGGTGMYIDSLVFGQSFPNVPPNTKLRIELEKYSIDELVKRLRSVNPKQYKNIDLNNRVRIIRAIEISEALGSIPKRKQVNRYNCLFIGLDLPRDQHQKIIQQRIVDRLEKQNMLEEERLLLKSGIEHKRLQELGLEYRYMSWYLLGEISYQEMIDQLTTKTVQFAKRQRTWFRRNKKIYWFNPITEKKEIDRKIKTFI